MKNKTVSIIIPAYNEEEYLPSCLASIDSLHYSKEHIEVIVVDNGSTDRTMEIARSYGAKVIRDDDMNVSGLRNFGAKHSKGEILAFIDSDCVVSSDWLINASKYFDNMKVSAWGSPPTLPEKPTWVQRTWYLVRKREKPVQRVDWLESMNLFVKKNIFFLIGGFNESLVSCEDVDLCYRIHQHGTIISDAQIKVVHMGEAKTVKDFFVKEIWRGISNLNGVRSHGLILREIPSLLIPIYFGAFIPLFFLIMLIYSNPSWLFVVVAAYLAPTLLVQIYFFSRTLAVLRRS